MSLTASLWTSVSGLLAHGQRMNTVGNNISNVNTVAYKAQRMDFEDFVYQYVGTASGVGQVGRGTSVGIIMNDFMQGSLETTTSATDIAIAGNGFFKVRPLNNNDSFYTRAGNFTFNRDGFLVDPHGYVLQGWMIDRSQANQTMFGDGRTNSGIVGTGSPVDIRMETFTCPPRHTTNLSLPINLRGATSSMPAHTADLSADPVDPFFALLKTWDATQNPPLGSSKYAFQSTIEVFDEGGRMHKLTVYYDRVVNDNAGQLIHGNSAGESYWEFVVTMDPSADVRDFASVFDPTGATPTTPNVPDELKGLLGAGVMTFSGSGEMKSMSMFVPNNAAPGSTEATNPGAQWWQQRTAPAVGHEVNLNNWIPAPISTNGFPMIAPGFSGSAGFQMPYAVSVDGTGYDFTRPNRDIASDRMIAMDLGMRNLSNEWHFTFGALTPNIILDPSWTPTIPDPTWLPRVPVTQGAPYGPGLAVPSTPSGTVPAAIIDASGTPVTDIDNWLPADIATPGALPPFWPLVQRTNAANQPLYVFEIERNDGSGTSYFFMDAAGAPNRPAGHTISTSFTPFAVQDLDTANPPTVANLIQPRPDIPNPTPQALIQDPENPWIEDPQTTRSWTTAAEIGSNKFAVNATGNFGELQPNATTNFGNASFEHNGKRQDGYTYGDLRYVNVDTNGVLSATYSNGVTLQLFQITLHDFPSLQNLRREGGNLWSETRESGLPSQGAAGTGVFGTTRSYALEQSNVDLAREFVNMITTQRGFQANSKNITTVDMMLENVINMKR